jgi:hypothetical protein
VKLPLASARLAAWSTAYLGGSVAPDHLAEHAVAPGSLHRVVGLGTDVGGDAAVSLPLALADLRRQGAARAWVLWPVAGDVAGLPGTAEVKRFVLAAGQAVLVEPVGARDAAGGTGAVVLVPSRVGDSSVLWNVLHGDNARVAATALADADQALKAALREATEALEELDVARTPADQADLVATLRERSLPLDLPDGFPSRARALIDTTQRLSALLEVARSDDGAAVSRSEAALRGAALSDLARAVRHGFVAGVNALAEEHARSR